MSSDFVEVHEMWRLCVGNPGTFSSPLSDSVWIRLQMTSERRWIVSELGGTMYNNIGTIIFTDPQSIVVFRLRAGV